MLKMFYYHILDHQIIWWPAAVESEDGDHCKFLAKGTGIGVVTKTFTADLLPMFLFRKFVVTFELLVDEWQDVQLLTAAQHSIMADSHKTFRQDMERESSDELKWIQTHDFESGREFRQVVNMVC